MTRNASHDSFSIDTTAFLKYALHISFMQRGVDVDKIEARENAAKLFITYS